MPENVANPVTTIDAAAGEAAVAAIRTQMMAIGREDLQVPNTDPSEAALKVLAVANEVNEPGLKARFEALPAECFDTTCLHKLGDAARAVIHTRTQLSVTRATSSAAKIPVATLGQATELRGDMLRVLEYNLGDDPLGPYGESVRTLRHIRGGRGHLDLSNDLSLLAGLYVEHADQLAADTRNYRADDASKAERLATEFQQHLSAAHPLQSDPDHELAARAWTFMWNAYEEVAETGRWMLRKERDVEKLFPRLKDGRRSRRKTSETTTPQ